MIEAQAWAAGLFEGEGNVYTRDHARDPRQGYGGIAQVVMTDEAVVRRFQAAVGVGRVHGPYHYRDDSKRSRSHHAPYWRWSTANLDDLVALLAMFGPWLGDRRIRQFQSAIEAGRLSPRRLRRVA